MATMLEDMREAYLLVKIAWLKVWKSILYVVGGLCGFAMCIGLFCGALFVLSIIIGFDLQLEWGTLFVCSLICGLITTMCIFGGMRVEKKIDKIESILTPKKVVGRSHAFYSDGPYSPSASFDARAYVESHCTSHRYGTASYEDINSIDRDSSLTFEQKSAAKSELEHLSIINY